MSKNAAKTGLGPTVLIAIEQYFPENQRGVEDRLAYQILPKSMRFLVSLMKYQPVRDWMVNGSERDIPGIWGGMICRKKYIDEKLIQFKDQINAIVNLGAGYDTRWFRLQELSKIPFYEIDQTEIISKKEKSIKNIFGSIPENLKLIPMDFEVQKISTQMHLHGYSNNLNTFFIMEAVTQYLTEKAVKETFDFLSKARSGSQLIFTYVRKDFIQGRAFYKWEKAYRKYIIKDKVWLFGLDPEEWPGFLKNYGWIVIEDKSYEELSEKYIKPTARNLASTEVERIIHARKI